MSSEWRLTKLGSLVDIKHGFAFKGEFFSEAPTSYQLTTPGNFAIGGGFQSEKVKYYHGPVLSDFVLSAGDLLVTMTDLSKAADTLGYAAKVPLTAGSTWLHNQRVGLVSLKSGANASKDFLHYLMRSPDYRNWVVSTATGSTVKHTSPSRICDYEFLLPPIEVQQEIATTLDALDDRIALLRETNATLEAIAQALFKSWFVDFDPVRAKMEGRQPVGMNEETAALFPDSFEESELGMVPRGWALKPFGSLLAHSIGGDWGSEQPEAKNTTRVAIIRGTDIPDLQSGRDNRVPIRYTSEKKLTTRQLQDGDIVIEVSGGSKDQPTGRALYATDELLKRFDCPVEPASFCRLFRPSDRATGVLLGQHLRYIYDQGKTWEYQNQSTGIANFQTNHFLEKELVVVPLNSILDVFSETVRPLLDRTITSQIDELSKIRDAVLPRLISGKLRMPEVAKEAEAALA
jgi:type I restriction enzyme, S subunit